MCVGDRAVRYRGLDYIVCVVHQAARSTVLLFSEIVFPLASQLTYRVFPSGGRCRVQLDGNLVCIILPARILNLWANALVGFANA